MDRARNRLGQDSCSGAQTILPVQTDGRWGVYVMSFRQGSIIKKGRIQP